MPFKPQEVTRLALIFAPYRQLCIPRLVVTRSGGLSAISLISLYWLRRPIPHRTPAVSRSGLRRSGHDLCVRMVEEIYLSAGRRFPEISILYAWAVVYIFPGAAFVD